MHIYMLSFKGICFLFGKHNSFVISSCALSEQINHMYIYTCINRSILKFTIINRCWCCYVYWHVAMCTDMLLWVLICCYVYWYVALCTDMLLCVLICCYVYWYVVMCIDMLLFVLICCYVYWHVAMCIDMLLCVLICCYVYWHVAMCIDTLLCVLIYSVWLTLLLPFPAANVPGAGTGVPGVQQSAVFSHRHQDGCLPSHRMCSLRQVSSTFIQCPNGHW